MKNQLTFKIVIGSLLLFIILGIIWGIGANRRITKLQADINVSIGKNLVYEQDAQKLKDSIAKLNTSYILLQKHTDSLVKVYDKKVSERDIIISKYKKEHQTISNLSDVKSIEYFNAEINSVSPVIITSVIPDTSFTIPGGDIKKANQKFVQNHELNETNYNLRESEKDLLRINTGLTLELNNRQTTVDRLTDLVSKRDSQIEEYQKQAKDKDLINKKQKRKDTFQKIGIGAAGAAAVILILTL